jgi:hypothetical protein
MIPVQSAVLSARQFMDQVYTPEEIKQLRIEEIYSSEDGKKWFVTVSWVEPATKQIGGFAGLANATIEPVPRVYKVFMINADNGQVVSMKMRD